MIGNILSKNLLALGVLGGALWWLLKNHSETSGLGTLNPLVTGRGIGGRPRLGRPKTEEERKLTHYLRYGSMEVPVRGAGLLRQGLI